MAAGGSVHLDGGATDFVTEDIIGLSDTLHVVHGRVVVVGGLAHASSASLGLGLLLLLLLLLGLLIFLLASEDVVGASLLLVLGLVVLAVVVSTEGERRGATWLMVHLD